MNAFPVFVLGIPWIFVQIAKNICPNCQIYLSKLVIVFSKDQYGSGECLPGLCTWHSLNFSGFNAFTPKSNSSTSITLFVFTLKVLLRLRASRNVFINVLCPKFNFPTKRKPLKYCFRCLDYSEMLFIRPWPGTPWIQSNKLGCANHQRDNNLRRIWYQNVKFSSASYCIMPKWFIAEVFWHTFPISVQAKSVCQFVRD